MFDEVFENSVEKLLFPKLDFYLVWNAKALSSAALELNFVYWRDPQHSYPHLKSSPCAVSLIPSGSVMLTFIT